MSNKNYKELINFADDMDSKTIKDALLKGERVILECKRAKTEVPKSIWQTYSAFANTIGGLILLGVDENLQEKDVSKRFQIIGVDEPSKIITDFWNTLNSVKVNENILVDSDVEVVNMDGAQIVCIHVPQADWRAKPIVCQSVVITLVTHKMTHVQIVHTEV